jgi:hypothetical protein
MVLVDSTRHFLKILGNCSYIALSLDKKSIRVPFGRLFRIIGSSQFPAMRRDDDSFPFCYTRNDGGQT